MIISLRLPCRAPKIMPHDSVSLYRAALSLNLSCYSDLSLLKLLVMCHVSCSVSLNLSHHTSIYQIRYTHTWMHVIWCNTHTSYDTSSDGARERARAKDGSISHARFRRKSSSKFFWKIFRNFFFEIFFNWSWVELIIAASRCNRPRWLSMYAIVAWDAE